MPGIEDLYTWLGGDERERFDRLIVQLKNGLGNLENADANWGALTNAQKDQAQRIAVRNVARMTRILLFRLEAE